ncbi:ABC transporter substrate-binding protein, partial [Streptomyces sp. SM14]
AAAAYTEAVAAQVHARSEAFAAAERRIADGLADFTVHRAYEPAYTQLAVNGTSPALKDERVRWALARGLDREAIASEAHGPARLPAEPLGSHLWVLGQDGYRDNSTGLGETGADSASRLLDEAGWRRGPAAPAADPGDEAAADAKTGALAAPATVPVRLGATVSAAQQRASVLSQAAGVATSVAADGESASLAEPAELTVRAARAARAQAEELARSAAAAVRVKSGTPLSLRFVLPDGPDAAELRAVGERITAMLAEAGVNAEITEVDAASYFDDHIVPGRFDLALYSWPASAFPATDARPLFAKPQGIPGGELFIEQNYTRVGTDHIDQLLSQAAAELDDERRAELLHKADTRLWSAAGSIPLYQSPQLVAAGNDVAGVGAFGLQTPRYQDIGFLR